MPTTPSFIGFVALPCYLFALGVRDGTVTGARFTDRDTGESLRIDAPVTIDATYEADVAAAGRGE